MHYTIYCDESRHCENVHHQYMAIGGLWIPTELRDAVNSYLKAACAQHHLNSELKWSKVSNRYLEGYKAFATCFWAFEEIRFRVILVPHAKIDYCKHHDGDPELGFYKFYYHMLYPWLHDENSYQILLDRKSNSQANRYHELEKYIRYKAWGSKIHPLQVIESKDSRIAQLADLLTGCMAASNSTPEPSGPKADFKCFVEEKLNVHTLAQFTSHSATFEKFNVFRIRLS